jgi:hypothetical protein
MLGDAVVYGFSLYAVMRGPFGKLALLKGASWVRSGWACWPR